MGKYYYRARNRKGEIIEASIFAENEWLARKLLSKINLIPLEIKRFNLKIFLNDLNLKVESLTQKISLEEKIILMNQIEMGISVGIPLIQMLHFLQSDQKNKRLLDAIAQITADISEGETLHGAFAKHPDIFDSTTVGLVKTGELTGKLDESLSRITQLLDQQNENKEKVKSAAFYPKIVVFTLVVVVGVIVYFVIPKLKTFLKSFGADLPPITKFVVGTSDFFVSYWYLILALVIGLKFSFNQIRSTPRGKKLFDQIVVKTPVLGKIFIYLELNNFCVILELLMSSGIPLIESLESLKASQKNQLFKEALGDFQDEISKGGTLTKGMEKHSIFPATFRNLIGIGEETGRLPMVLKRLGKYYQIQLDYLLGNLSKAIEPILLFFIFVAVLVLAIAVFLPIWKMNSSIRPKM